MSNLKTNKKIGFSVAALLKDAGITARHCEIIPLQGGNNRVYRLIADNDQYILKRYYVSHDDHRSRLSAEYIFLEFVREISVRNVPKPVFCDPARHLALYQYIEGKKPGKNEIGKMHVINALNFIEAINIRNDTDTRSALRIGMASDYCPHIREYVNSVNERVKRLSLISFDAQINKRAKEFIFNTVIPEWEKIKAKIRNSKRKYPDLLEADLILSPSDFGFHNSIVNPAGDIFFIDFEYAGWDDPLKMVCDFFCQPERPVPLKYLEYFIERTERMVCPAYDFRGKIMLLLPLFRIKWCCIVLNDFLNIDFKRRQYAFFNEDRREKQLAKALDYFARHFTRLF
ncbi:MAG: aminoglycoside phosphotransferase family protein [Deltaproteobacteria bacterium]|nr:aminoglycoside phosphotransferase family protein [Deltaproteobacteria bacterium]